MMIRTLAEARELGEATIYWDQHYRGGVRTCQGRLEGVYRDHLIVNGDYVPMKNYRNLRTTLKE